MSDHQPATDKRTAEKDRQSRTGKNDGPKKGGVGRRGEPGRGKGEIAKNRTNFSVYVKGFADDTSEDKLKDYFEEWGTVACVLLRGTESRFTRGQFAFVDFETEEGKDKCLANEKFELDGTEIMVEAQKSTRQARPQAANAKPTFGIYVKGFGGEVEEEALRSAFSEHGEIQKVTVHSSGDVEKIFSFVYFSDVESQQKALESDAPEINGTTVTVEEQKSKPGRRRRRRAPKKASE